MSATTRTTPRLIRLVAPASGRLRFHPPRALCGELEVFTAGDVILVVDDVPVVAPEDGFVWRCLRESGDRIETGEAVLEYRIVGAR